MSVSSWIKWIWIHLQGAKDRCWHLRGPSASVTQQVNSPKCLLYHKCSSQTEKSGREWWLKYYWHLFIHPTFIRKWFKVIVCRAIHFPCEFTLAQERTAKEGGGGNWNLLRVTTVSGNDDVMWETRWKEKGEAGGGIGKTVCLVKVSREKEREREREILAII